MYARLRHWAPRAESYLCLDEDEAMHADGTLILPGLEQVLAAPVPLAVGLVRKERLVAVYIVSDPRGIGDRDRRQDCMLIPPAGYVRVSEPPPAVATATVYVEPVYVNDAIEESLAEYLKALVSTAAGTPYFLPRMDQDEAWDIPRRMMAITLRRNGSDTMRHGWITLERKLYRTPVAVTNDERRVTGAFWYALLATENPEDAAALGWWRHVRKGDTFLELPVDLVQRKVELHEDRRLLIATGPSTPARQAPRTMVDGASDGG